MKGILSFVCLLLAGSILTPAFADDVPVTLEQLPSVSQEFVKTYFADADIVRCYKDSHSFEVRFADSSEIEFDYNGRWKEIDCKYREVPAELLSLIPMVIVDYVRSTYPSALITKVEAKSWGYEIELSNGLEIEFDKKGLFVKDD